MKNAESLEAETQSRQTHAGCSVHLCHGPQWGEEMECPFKTLTGEAIYDLSTRSWVERIRLPGADPIDTVRIDYYKHGPRAYQTSKVRLEELAGPGGTTGEFEAYGIGEQRNVRFGWKVRIPQNVERRELISLIEAAHSVASWHWLTSRAEGHSPAHVVTCEPEEEVDNMYQSASPEFKVYGPDDRGYITVEHVESSDKLYIHRSVLFPSRAIKRAKKKLRKQYAKATRRDEKLKLAIQRANARSVGD